MTRLMGVWVFAVGLFMAYLLVQLFRDGRADLDRIPVVLAVLSAPLALATLWLGVLLMAGGEL